MVSDRNPYKRYMILDETESIILGVTEDAPQSVREKLIVIAVEQFGVYGDDPEDFTIYGVKDDAPESVKNMFPEYQQIMERRKNYEPEDVENPYSRWNYFSVSMGEK